MKSAPETSSTSSHLPCNFRPSAGPFGSSNVITCFHVGSRDFLTVSEVHLSAVPSTVKVMRGSELPSPHLRRGRVDGVQGVRTRYRVEGTTKTRHHEQQGLVFDGQSSSLEEPYP